MILDHRGNPIDPATYRTPPKAKPGDVKEPRVGDAFGAWAGRDLIYSALPGGAVMQFDLTKLTLADYRAMRQHYQLGASLNVLSFVMHQIDWDIECEKQEIADMIRDDLAENWTPFIRGISQAFWSGYSPMAVNYENAKDYIRIKQFKDIVPEESRVNWKKIEGWAPPGKAKPWIYKYDGFFQNSQLIPAENTVWYPLLMENGDYYGRKLLKPAFPAWFFSNLIHLFANRYFERFGEPLPVGRAPFDESVDMGGGKVVSGKTAMEMIVSQIRSRAVTVLPSDRDPLTKEFDYSIDYLESQMRGADFERYLSRLDEEMSLSVFTPILLFRTADVGSYNLGQAHLRIFQQMLNAIAGDLQYYIQHYVVDRLRVLNFGQDSPRAKWVYRKQGQGDIETYKLLMNEVVQSGRAMPDLVELGAIVGLKFNEVEQIVADPPTPDPAADTEANTKTTKAARAILGEAAGRVAREFANGKTEIAMGYRQRIQDALIAGNYSPTEAMGIAGSLYAKVNSWLPEVLEIQPGADELKGWVESLANKQMDELAAA